MCPRSIQIIPGLLRARNRHEASIQELTNEGIEGSSKPSIPPFGSAKRPRTVPKNLIDWYGYVGTWLPEEGGVDEFPAETIRR
ncbi:hypothetical protein Tco_1283280 [Tanacetum coccineum]